MARAAVGSARAAAKLREHRRATALQENPSQLRRIVGNFGWKPNELFRDDRLNLLYASSVELQFDTLVFEISGRLERFGIRRVVIDALGDVEK